MKLLIITQAVDRNDPVLGFFHRWIEAFSERFEKVVVICLKSGEFQLPENVKVFSLGKEEGKSQAEYLSRFYHYIWQERKNYDVVFVHMNQEYVLLGGMFWRIFGKKIYLWRNHAQGSMLTRGAVFLSDKVFYTSPQSFTARFKKAIKMPVGIDTEFFKPNPAVARKPHSTLFLGRISPVKRVREFVEWFNQLDEKFTATVAGVALPKDQLYEKSVKSLASERIEFVGAVTQEQALKLYQSHETYVNMTPAGSYDKTILEAAACELDLIVENPDVKIELAGKKGKELRNFVVENHGLAALMDKLKKEI